MTGGSFIFVSVRARLRTHVGAFIIFGLLIPHSAEAASTSLAREGLFDQIWDPWFWFGMGAQGLFFGRFFVQWIASERQKRSVVPVSFWYISVAGACSLFVYAYHRRDLVIMLGAVLSCVIYLRNLSLIHGRAKSLRLAGLPADEVVSPVKNPEGGR